MEPLLISFLFSPPPDAHHGFDKKGQPIYIDCTGRADVDKVLSLVTKEEVVHTHILLMEWQARVLMKAASEARGATVHHMLNVVDLHGCSLRLAARRSVDIFQAIAAVDQPNYPETSASAPRDPRARDTLLRHHLSSLLLTPAQWAPHSW